MTIDRRRTGAIGLLLAAALLVEARLAQRQDEGPPGKTPPPVQGREPEGGLEIPSRPQPGTRTDSLLLPREGERQRLEPDSLYQMGGVQVRLHRDDKAIAAEKYVLEHWIPCVAGTAALPDALRRWAFIEIQDANFARHQIEQVVSGAAHDGLALATAD